MAKTKALSKTDKKILITGGTGFLGTHIVRQFFDAGEKHLRVMASSVRRARVAPEHDSALRATASDVTEEHGTFAHP